MYLAEIDLPENAKELASGLPVKVDIVMNPATQKTTPSEKFQ